jgi:hypothetical protein
MKMVVEKILQTFQRFTVQCSEVFYGACYLWPFFPLLLLSWNYIDFMADEKFLLRHSKNFATWNKVINPSKYPCLLYAIKFTLVREEYVPDKSLPRTRRCKKKSVSTSCTHTHYSPCGGHLTAAATRTSRWGYPTPNTRLGPSCKLPRKNKMNSYCSRNFAGFLIWNKIEYLSKQIASYPMGTRGSFPGGKADHTPPSSAEAKNAWSYTSTPQYVVLS